MSKSVQLTLTPEMAELAMYALRLAADDAEESIEAQRASCGLEQPGLLRWLATYIEHKLRDARMPEATR